MTLLLDPSTWAGLLTLIILEIVLGIDNLVFVAILSEKLPPCKQDKARLIGLSAALIMRLGLLILMSWMITLTSPIINNKYFSFSGRDLILLFGGLFLSFKAIIELNERLDSNIHKNKNNKHRAEFWTIVIQIVILDSVFSLDAIVTAVGMINKLPIMMMAVIIAMILMLLASKPLTKFINSHQTVVVLCLSFLLMVGCNLVSEALGLDVPKGYLYAAIGFSIIIEILNQIARRNFILHQFRKPMRQRVAESVLKLMIGNQFKNKTIQYNSSKKNEKQKNNYTSIDSESFKEEEKYMIHSVLTLAARSIRSIMTPRNEISWVDIYQQKNKIRCQLLDTPHSLFPVCKGQLDEVIGIVRAKELLIALEKTINIIEFCSTISPIIIPDTLDPINLLGVLRRAKGSLVIITNEFGAVQGLITPLDVLEAIAGEFPDADETPDIIFEKDGWLVKGGTDLHSLKQCLNITNLIQEEKSYASLAGLLISHTGQLPIPGETIIIPPLKFHILEATQYQIHLVRITKEQPKNISFKP
ncbi:MAG: TerC family protein [Buchnera aphidicola (Chaetogeoica yunlongensis)]